MLLNTAICKLRYPWAQLPAEGCDQRQQCSRNAVLIQRSAILQAAIHHADDKVKLLMIQNCTVLLYVQVKLMGEAAAGSSPLQGPENSWKQLKAETRGNVEQKAAQGDAHLESVWRQPSSGSKQRKYQSQCNSERTRLWVSLTNTD